MPERETRILQQELAEVRISKDGKTLAGYGAVFGSRSKPLGGFVEEIARGAKVEFEDVHATYNHSPDQLLGRVKSGTLRVTIDDVGIRYSVDLPNTTAGRDVRELVERGDVDGSSFAFDTLDDEWSRKDDITLRTLKAVKVYELGPVAFPAYPDTTVAVRSLQALVHAGSLVLQDREQRRRAADFPRLQERRREQELAALCKGPDPDGDGAG